MDAKRQEKLREINKQLSVLTLKFGDNVLKETNSFKLVIDKRMILAGLPDAVVDAAAETAKEQGLKANGFLQIQKPSLIPFPAVFPKA